VGTQSLRSTGATLVVVTRIAGLPKQLNIGQGRNPTLRQLFLRVPSAMPNARPGRVGNPVTAGRFHNG
jgi:hypothetical protein